MYKYLSRNAYFKAARLLGINVDGNKIFFEFEDEASYVIDFAINDIKIRGKTPVETYQKNNNAENKIEKQILQALTQSYTSLFSIIGMDYKKHTVMLHDVLNNSNIEITDYHLSKTINKNTLLFCRIVCLNDFNMTSGIAFVFAAELKEYLLSTYERMKKENNMQPDNIVRFVSFFRLNRTDGYDIVYIDPP